MNDQDFEGFEADLQKLKPAAPPPELMARLAAAAEPAAHPARELPAGRFSLRELLVSWLRWFAPAMAAAAVALVVWRWPHPATSPVVTQPPAPATAALKPGDVQLDRRLVGAFDALAQLPSGETVRFRCQEFTDQMVLRDLARGLEVVQSTPSFEVLAVGFETY